MAVLDNLSTGIENISAFAHHPLYSFRPSMTLRNEPVLTGWPARRMPSCIWVKDPSACNWSPNGRRRLSRPTCSASHAMLAAMRYRCRTLLAKYQRGLRQACVLFAEDDDPLLGAPTRSRWSYVASKLLDEFPRPGRTASMTAGDGRAFLQHRRAGQTRRYGMVVPRFRASCFTGEPIPSLRRRR